VHPVYSGAEEECPSPLTKELWGFATMTQLDDSGTCRKPSHGLKKTVDWGSPFR